MRKVAVSPSGDFDQHLVPVLGSVQSALFDFQQKAHQSVGSQEVALRLAHHYAGKRRVVFLQNAHNAALPAVVFILLFLRLDSYQHQISGHGSLHKASRQKDVLRAVGDRRLALLWFRSGKPEFFIERNNLCLHQSLAVAEHD